MPKFLGIKFPAKKNRNTKRDDVFDTIYFIEFDENILHKRLTKTYNCFRFFYTTKTDNRNSIFRREKKLIIIFILFFIFFRTLYITNSLDLSPLGR